MDLILLSYGVSAALLLPSRRCNYDKSLNFCYTGDPSVDALINPNMDTNFAPMLYRSKFTDYCIVNNPKVAENIVFLYGHNPSGNSVYLIFLHPVGSMPTMFQQGSLLDDTNFISAGIVDHSMSNSSPEEKTKYLFTQVKNLINISATNPVSSINQFTYFNSKGCVFCTEYATTSLRTVDVDSVSGNQVFRMKFY
ncbi:hypothetical protein [Ehrlichia japonica]|uniref:Uncharacterized protein n=1 Tax=Ehrlichia japonica TaxID=391036 RepID=X5GL68_9RICK|nr:hypothetical protein [Ehrlichia japonica]AHX04891.1 hypothetical protein EHF_0496 [Ehrlichia japonica]